MIVAVEGCGHGELDAIYASLAAAEAEHGVRAELLIICGDFQACRDADDLRSLACPAKYRRLGDFAQYHRGEKRAPVLTIFIGGNHEASNHLWELYYGGWVAENIYFLGYSGVVVYKDLLIAGFSGIYKNADYTRGYFERPPYNHSTLRSIYHTREFEIQKLRAWGRRPDIFLSHDWPAGIHHYGDAEELERRKEHLGPDLRSNGYGSPPAMELLRHLRPAYWFSAHLHVKFAALVDWSREPRAAGASVEGVTRFLALDKCLAKRDFLQLVEVAAAPSAGAAAGASELRYDPDWLAVVRAAHAYWPVGSTPRSASAYPFDSPEFRDSVAAARAAITPCLQQSGCRIPPWRPAWASQPREWRRTASPQTEALCALLGLPNAIASTGQPEQPPRGSVAQQRAVLASVASGVGDAQRLLDGLLGGAPGDDTAGGPRAAAAPTVPPAAAAAADGDSDSDCFGVFVDTAGS